MDRMADLMVNKSHLLIAIIAFALPIADLSAQTAPKPEKKAPDSRARSKLGVRFGERVVVVGLAVKGNTLGPATGPTILVQSINGKQTQTHIRICVRPAFHGSKFGDKPIDRKNALFMDDFGGWKFAPTLPKFVIGKTYRFTCFETGYFTGLPEFAKREINFTNIPSFHFHNRLKVVKGEIIKPIRWKPKQFLGQNAMFRGVAKNHGSRAVVVSENGDWKIIVVGKTLWDKYYLGKRVEIRGRIKQTDSENVFECVDAETGFADFADKLNRNVSLRGMLLAMNNHWRLKYRGIDIDLPDYKPTTDWWRKTVSVRGRLQCKGSGKDKKYFIKHPEVKRDKPLLSVENWRDRQPGG